MAGVTSTLILNDKMTGVLNRINRAMGLVVNSFDAVQRASGKSFDTVNMDAARRELGAANALIEEMAKEYGKAGQELEKHNKKLYDGTGIADKLLNKIKALTAAYTGKKIIGLSDELTSTTARLDMMNDGLQDTATLQQKIYRSAERSRASYQSTADAVSKLGLMAGDAFGSSDEIIFFMEQINKQFTIAGTDSAGISAAMLQLTQAMGSGVLRGEEFNSILEQAPNIIQTIADYMGVPKGQLKDMAAQGKITAETVKAAVFAAADETNAKFESMPKTFSQIWTSAKNAALMAFTPVLQKLNDLANSNEFQTVVKTITNTISKVADIAIAAFNILSKTAGFVVRNWGFISPVVYGVVAALTLYYTVTRVSAAVTAISTAITKLNTLAEKRHAAALKIKSGATLTATAAQYGFNAALLACPLTWIILAIIAVVAAIYLIVEAINQAQDETISATGVITGALSAVGSFIQGLIGGFVDLVISTIKLLVKPWVAFANFFGNIFTDPIGAIIHLFGDMADWVLAVLQGIASALDFVFGTSMADTVQGWRDGLSNTIDLTAKEYGNGQYEEIMHEIDFSAKDIGFSKTDIAGAYRSGYRAGESIDNKLKGGFDDDTTNDILNDIQNNTQDISDSVSSSDETLEYLRDIAEQDAINRFTTAEIKVEMNNSNNINSTVDIDGMVDALAAGVEDAMNKVAEGVHE